MYEHVGEHDSATSADSSELFDSSTGNEQSASSGANGVAHAASAVDAAALDAHIHAAAAVVGDAAAAMALEIESDVMKSHMELLRNSGMVLDSANATSAVASNSDNALTSSTNGIADSGDAAVTSTTHPLALPVRNSSTDTADQARTSSTLSLSSSTSSVSAVYRWYDVEDNIHLKRKEESSIAKCTLCRLQGKVERKTLVRFSKSVTSNLWRHLKENHPDVYSQHASEKKRVPMHVVGATKRGRKKKLVVGIDPTAAAVPIAGTSSSSGARVDDSNGDDALPSDHRAAKKPKHTDEVRPDEHLLASGAATATSGRDDVSSRPPGVLAATTSHHRQSEATAGPSSFSIEKVREALAYLCLYELLPLDVCASHAFQRVLLACAGGTGGSLDDSQSVVRFGLAPTRSDVKKLAVDVQTRVANEMKAVDGVHLVAAEWTPVASSAWTMNEADATQRFLALSAVGLDHDFNAFRRCLYVAPLGHYRDACATLTDALTHVGARVTLSQCMPQVLALEPSVSKCFSAFASASRPNVVRLESVSSLLQSVMLATLYGETITAPFHLGSAIPSTGSDGLTLRDRRLDSSASFIESVGSSSDAATADEDPLDELYELEPEVPTPVLEELPSRLTGHTLRDVVVKALYLLAHLKQSRASRHVLARIAIDDLGVAPTVFAQTCNAALQALHIAFGHAIDALAVLRDLQAPLTRYFEMHRDGTSDVAKLVQLAALSPYEWTRLAHLQTVLKPFADATRKLDAERFVAASLIIPTVFTLLGKLRGATSHSLDKKQRTAIASHRANTVSSDDDLPEDILALKDAAFANLSASFGYLFIAPVVDWPLAKQQTFELLWTATLLDPRTRPFVIKWPLSQPELWAIVKREAAAIAGTAANGKDADDAAHDLTDDTGMPLDEDNDSTSDTTKTSDLWDDLEANLASCAHEEMLLSAAKTSLELAKATNVLETEVASFQDESHIALHANPLEWWHGLRLKYPLLARLARYVLALPVTVRTDDAALMNPVAADNGLVRCAGRSMSRRELCELLAASMNLRLERSSSVVVEAASKQMWSTV